MTVTSIETILAEFGARLRELRYEAGLTQEALALNSGIDRSYVGQVERGERNISLENIVKLANGLGVVPHKLLEPPHDKKSRSSLRKEAKNVSR